MSSDRKGRKEGVKGLNGVKEQKGVRGLLLTLCSFSVLTRHGETAAHSIRWARYHVMSRGDRREAIFYDDADRVEFKSCRQELAI